MKIACVSLEMDNAGLSYAFVNSQTQSVSISTSQISLNPRSRVRELATVLHSIGSIELLLVPHSKTNSDGIIESVQQELFETTQRAIRVLRVPRCKYASAMSLLVDLRFSLNEPESTRAMRFERLSAWIDVESASLVRSLGSLIGYLLNNSLLDAFRFSVQASIDYERNPLDRVAFNTSTLRYLSIFRDEIHPSMIKGKGKPKEGFSVFMLFSKFIRTNIGKHKLKHLFTTPTFNLDVLHMRNELISLFYSLPSEKINMIRSNLSQCGSLSHILGKLRDVSMSFDDWRRFKLTIQHILNLISILRIMLKELEDEINTSGSNEDDNENNFRGRAVLEHFRSLGKSSEKDIFDALSFLNGLLDDHFEFDIQQGEIRIREGILPELDTAIAQYEKLKDVLMEHSEQEMRRLDEEIPIRGNREHIHPMTVEFFPIIGFYVAIHGDFEEDRSDEEFQMELLLSEDYEFGFSVEGALLFKCGLTSELDEMYGDVHCMIIDMQRNVVREVEAEILKFSQEIEDAQELIGEIDLFFCLFESAEAYQLSRAELVSESTLLLLKSKNILTELAVGDRQFVVNNFAVHNIKPTMEYPEIGQIKSRSLLHPDFSNRCQFLTGPNFSGKSVLLKTIGMVCYLAHIGSFVPCRFAKIGMVDSIYTTCGQQDSILNFKGETLREISTLNFILTQATPRSLLLIDELGKNLMLNESIQLNLGMIRCLTEDDFTVERANIRREIRNNSNVMSNSRYCLSKNIEYMVEQYSKIPIVIMASHLTQLFQEPSFEENYLLRFVCMEVIIEEDQSRQQQQLNSRSLLHVRGGDYSHLKKSNMNNAPTTVLNAKQKVVPIYRLRDGMSLQSCAALVTKNILGTECNDQLISRIFQVQKMILERSFEIEPIQELVNLNLLRTTETISKLSMEKS